MDEALEFFIIAVSVVWVVGVVFLPILAAVEWEPFRDDCDCSNLDTQECEHERSKDGNCSLEACPLRVRTVSTLARPKAIEGEE